MIVLRYWSITEIRSTDTKPATVYKRKRVDTCNRPRIPANRRWTLKAVTRTPLQTARQSAWRTWPDRRDSCRSATTCRLRRRYRPRSPSCSSSSPPNRPRRNRSTPRRSEWHPRRPTGSRHIVRQCNAHIATLPINRFKSYAITIFTIILFFFFR